MLEKHVDILAIGDITVDAFVKLHDAKIHCKINRDDCEICLPFGAKIPYEYSRLVYASGGAANAAIGATRLGLRTTLVSNLGDDLYGRENLIKLQKEKVNVKHVSKHTNKASNVSFILWYEDDRTILVHHVDYEHDFRVLDPKVGLSPKWIYLTSLSAHASRYEETLTHYLDARPLTKLAFQPGTSQIERGIEDLHEIAKRTEVLILNVEEAQHLLRVNDRDIKKLGEGLAKYGSKIVLITDGTKGAYMFDGEHYYHIPLFPDPRKAVERTGCGDAFASTFISLLSLGRSPLESLVAAPVNAMSVAQYVGAHEGLLSLEQIDWLLARAPVEYKPRVI